MALLQNYLKMLTDAYKTVPETRSHAQPAAHTHGTTLHYPTQLTPTSHPCTRHSKNDSEGDQDFNDSDATFDLYHHQAGDIILKDAAVYATR